VGFQDSLAQDACQISGLCCVPKAQGVSDLLPADKNFGLTWWFADKVMPAQDILTEPA
jgi:hypothetical protein